MALITHELHKEQLRQIYGQWLGKYIWTMLGKYMDNGWANIYGQLLGKYMDNCWANIWTMVGQIYGQLFGKYMDNCLANIWTVVGNIWTIVGQIYGVLWAILGVYKIELSANSWRCYRSTIPSVFRFSSGSIVCLIAERASYSQAVPRRAVRRPTYSCTRCHALWPWCTRLQGGTDLKARDNIGNMW